MARNHLVKVLLDDEDKAMLVDLVAEKKLSQSDTIRMIIRDEHEKLSTKYRDRAANG